MATGRRGNPVLKPYERQQVIGGEFSPRADTHYQKNYIGEALQGFANLTDKIYRSMEQDKFDKYERDIDTAKNELFLKIESTEDSSAWYEDYKAYKEYKKEHGKEILGDRLYNKWLGEAERGYGSAERDDFDFQKKIVPKILNNAKSLRLENVTQNLTNAILADNPEKAAELTRKAYSGLNDVNIFSPAEIEKFKNETEKNAYSNAYSSLLEKSPDKALALVETKEFKEAIKDPSLIEQYRNNAQSAVTSFRVNRDFQNIVQKEGKANTYLQQIFSGDLRDATVIEKDPDLTRPQKDILIKCMGERLSKSGKGSGAGIEGVSELEVLTKIKADFDNLFMSDTSKASGYTFRSGLGPEETAEYNEIKLQKAIELKKYIIDAWSAGYISTDAASTRLSAIQNTLTEFNRSIIGGKDVTLDNLSSNAYESGLVTLNQTFSDYGIVDPVEKNDYELRFFKGVDEYLKKNNLTANDFVNLPKSEKDSVTLNVASNIIKDMVNYNMFFDRIPNARGQSSNSIVAGAKNRYAEKVKRYNETLKVDNWAFYSYDNQQEERLRDLASEAYREEIESVVSKQKNIDTQIKAKSLLQSLERQENEEFLTRLVTAKEEELKKIKSSIPRIGTITPTGETATLYFERELDIEKEYAEKSESLRLLKEGDEKATQEAIDNQEDLEEYILEQLG